MPTAPTFKRPRSDEIASTTDRELLSAMELIRIIVDNLPLLESLLERSTPQGTIAIQDAEDVAITGGSGEFDRLVSRFSPATPDEVVRLGDLLGQRNATYGLVVIR